MRYGATERFERDSRYYSDNISIIKFNEIEKGRTILHKNTPNPFCDETTFIFYIPEKAGAEFTILNILGEVVDMISFEEMEKVNSGLIYNSNNLPAGNYYYRLETGCFSEAGKMMIIK